MRKDITAENRALENRLRELSLFPNTSAPWQQLILDDLLQLVPEGTNCVDAACGIGNNTATLLGRFKQIVAFDRSHAALNFGRSRRAEFGSRVAFLRGELERIPLRDKGYDCVVCTEALEHVEDVQAVISELYRIVRTGGHAIISFQNHLNIAALQKYTAERRNGRNWDAWGTHGHEGGYENYLTCLKVRRLVKETGFKAVHQVGADYLNAWLSWLPGLRQNYRILDRCPMRVLGRVPLVKCVGMDYFMVLEKP